MHQHKRKGRRTHKSNKKVSRSLNPKLKNWYSSADEGLISKAETNAKIKYVQTYLLNSGSTSTAARYIKSNDAYDVDPSVGSTATTGFTEWTKFYTYFRVVGYKTRLHFVNTNSIPVVITVGETNVTLGLSSGNNTTTDLFPYSGNKNFQKRVLTANTSGGSKCTITCFHTISQIVGSTSPETDDNFRGGSTASPIDLTYIVFGATSFAGASIPNNVDVMVEHELVVRFFDYIPLTA